ncbi:MAG: radical SAM protein [Thermoprotei archaeon]|nr:MAG: radical SAM protein [Thermoprotei archaeon]
MFLNIFSYLKKKRCLICGKESIIISSTIGVCADCLRERPEEALRIAMRAHRESKSKFGLPSEPPRDPDGVLCKGCALQCKIGNGKIGYCGLVKNVDGRLIKLAGTPDKGLLEWYYDPLPTNCVADWVCPGCTGAGYPKYSYSRRGPEYGYYNLAVFYGACNLDCLFCQNWQYRKLTRSLSPLISSKELASHVTPKVSCICYFGGDPSPQMSHAISASIIALERKKEGILRICWETNGLMNRGILKTAVELSLESGGIVKFDIKAWNPAIYKALTGVDNKALWDNIKTAANYISERKDPPLIVASTLLVPGYVDVNEVRAIAEFLASIDRDIPYSLLAFHPDYMMRDLPPTSYKHAKECVKAAREAGLKNVHIGNIWLLSQYY